MKTRIINEVKKGKKYLYELENTIFFVEGGGQLKDEGTINGIEVLSCYEYEGRIYHEVASKIETEEVELWVDENHRYISKQGHTAQHLLSAAIYELYGISTVSHHYNLEGSYIDVEVDELSYEQLQEAEAWVNKKIREHRNVQVLYPTKKEFENMPIHHTLKVEENIRIVHIEGVEYNPCKGMHVDNTSEVQLVIVLGKEKIKGNTRIHYMFGEVARNHFHIYSKELKNISVLVSKPMEDSYNGVLKVKESMQITERKLANMENSYVDLYAKEFEGKAFVVHECDLEGELVNKLSLKLSEMDGLNCYLFTPKQIIAIAGNDSSKNAKQMFEEIKMKFEIKGGGNLKICRGSSSELDEIKKYVLSLK